MRKYLKCLAAILMGCLSLTVLHANNNQVDKGKEIQRWITQLKESMEKNSDQLPDYIRQMEEKISGESDPGTQAVLHSMLAEMYQNFYSQSAWQFNQRTPISGYVPEDIREWPANLFTEKVREELNFSLQPAEVLQSTPASRFREILTPGEDSPELRPTLYDFLAWRALTIQPTDSIFQELVSFRRSQPDEKAVVLAEIAYIQYKNPTYEKQMAALDSLLQRYQNRDFSVEIINAKLNLIELQRYTTNNPDSVLQIAWDLATATQKRFPNYSRIGLITNRLKNWENPYVTIETAGSVYPDKEIAITLSYTNINKVEISLYQSTLNAIEIQTGKYRSDKENKGRGELISKQEISLNTKTAYTQEKKEIKIPGSKAGFYELVIRVPGKDIEVKRIINITTLATSSRNIPGRGTEIYVTDLITGKPLPNTTVRYYEGAWNNLKQSGTVSTDKNGIALLPDKKEITGYDAIAPDGKNILISSVYPSYYSPQQENEKALVTLLTDRKLYRPGQTIQFKGIAYSNDKYNPVVLPNRSFTVYFYDANNQEINKQTYQTNEFGSFHGEFTIPQQGLTGFYSMRTENGRVQVRVEEYKRPTFFVEFNPVKEDVARGDLVSLQGQIKTFSGVPLSEASGTYRITRHTVFLRSQDEQTSEGNLQIKEDGTFRIEFRTEKGEENQRLIGFDQYIVSVMITDNKGESQEESTSFAVGEKSLVLFINTLSPQENKENLRLSVRAQTMNGENIHTTGIFSIYTLLNGEEPYSWKEGKMITKETFETGKEIGPDIFRTLPSGRYRILFEATDSQGRKAETPWDITLYSKADKAPPIFSPLWIVNNKSSYLPGETAEIIIGSSFKDAWILYEIIEGNKLVSREIIKLSNENRTLRIPFLPAWKDGATISFTLIKEGQLYWQNTQIFRQYPDRTLSFRPNVFRDKLKPGQQEEWSFRITGPDSLAVQAEVLGLMYDMSLDKIYSSALSFSLPAAQYMNTFYFSVGEGLRTIYETGRTEYDWIHVPEFSYDVLDWQGINFYPSIQVRGGGLMRKSGAIAEAAVEDSAVHAVMAYSGRSTNNIITEELSEAQVQSYGGIEENKGVTVADIRQNFNETAFFYPTLLTDQAGNVHLNFTIPESNTTWHLQMLAHTRDMKYGVYSNQVITQKPVMVVPNLPRFVRKGDRVTFSAQIINQTGNSLTGTVTLELFNPETGELITPPTANKKEFTIEKDKNGAVSWQWEVPYTNELIGVRIIATSPEGSDGEQHLLPVVSDEILITESTTFYIEEENRKTVEIPSGIFTGTSRPLSLTFEATANPIWYAVQALPTLNDPQSDNIIDWFNFYYSNVVANALVSTTPRLQSIINAWNRQGGDAETLLSQLQKNEELKQILINETPWVMEAKNQTEQLQRLTLLFDINRSATQKATAIQKLQERQLSNGAWSWYNGFYASRRMTQYILKGMSQLVNLNAIQYNQQEKEMQMKALRYLDELIDADYKALQKNSKELKNYLPTPLEIEFLLIRSAYRDIPESAETRDAIRYYTQQATKLWEKLSLEGKASMALLLYRNGETATANKIVEWFRKTATISTEAGMYWANNRSTYGNFTTPIEVHCLIMDMFRDISPRENEINKMKQWLLIQKRTQQWGTAPATMNAVYILLKTGTGWLDSNNVIEIKWRDNMISSEQGEIATGYVKERFSVENISPADRSAEVMKEGSSPAWGAIYSQYFTKLENVSNTSGLLDIDKKLFIETNDGKQRIITPVTEEQSLKVGDKVVVRLTIRTGQEMNYIYLHDLRPGYMEPTNQLSGTQYRDGILYYRSPRDLSENFFIERLPAGTFILEYSGYVSRSGEYSGGVATIQCLYAPEYSSHTEGSRIEIR